MIDKRMDCKKTKKIFFFLHKPEFYVCILDFYFYYIAPKLHETWSEELHNLHFIY